MERHLLCAYADGVAGLKPICEVLRAGVEPRSSPVVYETIGTDLNGKPIEAGLGSFTWTWEWLWQEDYDFLLDLQGDTPGASVYARTSERSGASGIDFSNYLAIAKRPTFESREALKCLGVTLEFTSAEPS